MIVDYALRFFSVAVLFGVLHQIVAKKSAVSAGLGRHILIGRLAVMFGAVISALITIRGFRHEGGLTMMYALHLLTGGSFLSALFVTAFLGRRVRITGASSKLHGWFAYLTLLLLAITLFLGIATTLLH